MRRFVPVLAVTLMHPAALMGEESPGSKSFGPPPGTRTEYEIDPGSGAARTITVFCLPGPGGGEAIVLDPTTVPLDFFKLGTNDLLLRTHPLFGTIDARGISPGAAWEGDETVPVGFAPKVVKVKHSTELVEGSPAAIGIRSRLAAPEELGGLGYRFVLRTWERDLVLDRADLRPLEVVLKTEIESYQPGAREAERAEKESKSFKETAHRPLTREECAALESEAALLKRVLAAMASRRSGGGVLSLFLGKPKSAPPDPLAVLDEYEKAHREGLLAAAVRPLRTLAREAIDAGAAERAAEEKRAKLIGSPAPDFTLEDLEGKKVSLSDFRGKTVLLSFWGYG
jgi:hypothetical protein